MEDGGNGEIVIQLVADDKTDNLKAFQEALALAESYWRRETLEAAISE